MKYYTQRDLEDMGAYIAGWAIGTTKQGKTVTGQITVAHIRRTFKPRDIKDLLEKPVKI